MDTPQAPQYQPSCQGVCTYDLLWNQQCTQCCLHHHEPACCTVSTIDAHVIQLNIPSLHFCVLGCLVKLIPLAFSLSLFLTEACLLSSMQADIFSYGVILWEIVTQEIPCGGGLRDCKVPEECPAEIDQLINACLSQDPEDRPTATDICKTIRQWQQVTLAAIKIARRTSEVMQAANEPKAVRHSK